MSGIESTNSILQNLGLTQEKAPQAKEDFGKQEFLELMLAQLNNQDPMEPMENGEFLSQIAQFTTATGVSDLHSAFADLANSLSSNQALQASSLVGRTVLVPTSSAYLASGEGVSGRATVSASTSQLNISIYDAAGQAVRTIPLGQQPAGEIEFNWDGKLDNGTNASTGYYTIRAEALIGGEVQAMQGMIAKKVESVSLGASGGQGVTLNVTGSEAISLSNVRQIM